MKVNFNQSFKDFKGKEIGVMISDEIGKILFNVSSSGNSPLTPDEKYMAYKLCNNQSRRRNGAYFRRSSFCREDMR